MHYPRWMGYKRACAQVTVVFQAFNAISTESRPSADITTRLARLMGMLYTHLRRYVPEGDVPIPWGPTGPSPLYMYDRYLHGMIEISLFAFVDIEDDLRNGREF